MAGDGVYTALYGIALHYMGLVSLLPPLFLSLYPSIHQLCYLAACVGGHVMHWWVGAFGVGEYGRYRPIDVYIHKYVLVCKGYCHSLARPGLSRSARLVLPAAFIVYTTCLPDGLLMHPSIWMDGRTT